MKHKNTLAMALLLLGGCFSDVPQAGMEAETGGEEETDSEGVSDSSSSGEDSGMGGTGSESNPNESTSGTGGGSGSGSTGSGDASTGGEGSSTEESSTGAGNSGAHETDSEGTTESETEGTSGTAGESTGGGIGLDEPCDPLDAENLCADGLVCSQYEWDNWDNVFRYYCKEYLGHPDGGGFGDPVSGVGECGTGYTPINNINGVNFPDGICPGNGTCCTPICSSLNTGCPAGMICNLSLEPMDAEYYEADSYGECMKG